MKRIKKQVLFIIMGLSFLMPAIKADAVDISVTEQRIINEDKVLYADSIVKRYRLYQGRYQYRRWNETRGYWVDPAWIDI